MPVQEEIYVYRRWIALRHRLHAQTGHDGVTALCYEQTRHICRQRTTSLLATTPEKDTHTQNRERVPLRYCGKLFLQDLEHCWPRSQDFLVLDHGGSHFESCKDLSRSVASTSRSCEKNLPQNLMNSDAARSHPIIDIIYLRQESSS